MAMGVDPSLDSLAAYIVQASNAYFAHDYSTMNSLLESFWSAESALNPGTTATFQNDVTKLDAYSHRFLGYEYWQQINSTDPNGIPAVLEQATEQFNTSVNEFNASGCNQQALDDSNILVQLQGWASQDAASWIDTSFMASVQQVVSQATSAAGNLISDAAGSIWDSIPTPVLLASAGLAAILLIGLVRR
jgi:hypothetical protein